MQIGLGNDNQMLRSRVLTLTRRCATAHMRDAAACATFPTRQRRKEREGEAVADLFALAVD